MRGTELDRVFREEWSAVLATLVRRLGDLQRAEDATAEAFVAAARTWPANGVPPKPGAWLTVTAWRKALDQLRKDRSVSGPAADALLAELTDERDEVDDEMLGTEDDQLRLILTCCHPALALEVRVALTLRYVAGLTTREIASAFVLPEPTMAQRLVRAKRKIRQAAITFDGPGANAVAERLAGVQSVVYLVFNEGYSATGGDELVRGDLCDEAIWLGRLLHRLMPGDAETNGLLALMLLHHARTPGRQDADGRPVSLADQDRRSWRRDMIEEGVTLLAAALARRAPGPYQVQAAIAALHARATSFKHTDWAQIADLYGELARLAPSPVIEVNRAVAVGMAHGPKAGLAVLESILASGVLTDYGPLHAAHADLLDRAGDRAGAEAAWAKAIETTGNEALREGWRRRAARGASPAADEP